jgi:hypothetical protein
MTGIIKVTNVVNHEDGSATAKKFLESLPITLQEKIQKAQKKTWRIASQKPVRPPQQLLTEYAEITPMLQELEE